MKRTTLSIIHVLLAAAAFMLFASTSKADNIKVEIVPYRLVPANDVYCQINVELIEPVTMMGMPDIYKEEITEILIERVVFEETNPFAINEVFQIDTLSEFRAILKKKIKGLNGIIINIDSGTINNLPRPTKKPNQLKKFLEF